MKKEKVGEPKNKVVIFSIVLFATIILARISAKLANIYKISRPSINGIQFHHFDYGLILLILITLIYLFWKIKPRILLVLSAISLGLIVDELVFTMSRMTNFDQYSTTLISSIILGAIIVIICFIIDKFNKK